MFSRILWGPAIGPRSSRRLNYLLLIIIMKKVPIPRQFSVRPKTTILENYLITRIYGVLRFSIRNIIRILEKFTENNWNFLGFIFGQQFNLCPMVTNMLKNNINGSPSRFHIFSDDSMRPRNRPGELKRSKLFALDNNNEKFPISGQFCDRPKTIPFWKIICSLVSCFRVYHSKAPQAIWEIHWK